ncbi:tripartite tricarboxylate transporter permease [Naumannella halotolerans]|uniref:TctA family transporter n=1 Tax=Naumannella halotolerans TaxID=993414 RepID=A0A4R7J2C9_9ACTN|nr:tripartite tricarboxylate transporter permease [Naumannella halotolerans]TDT31234.1 TctA family transporter [Naumannella halotolerans]
MDLFSNLALGFETAFQWQNILWCLLGVAIGTAVGVLPGIGPTAAIAMLLPLTFSFGEPVSALIMLAGIYYGAQYGGSTTAILLNMPGESSSAVTAIDGHQMAKMGRAGVALATAAVGSFFAGTVATLVLAVAAPPLARVALQFGPADYFSLMLLGLVISIALARGSVLNALAMIFLGLLLGTVGQDAFTGQPRFTFGLSELYGGLNFVSVAVGIFGIAEILRNLLDPETRNATVSKVSSLLPTKEDVRRSVGPILRATGLGSVLGILPGGGHILSSFASYSVEKQLSPRKAEFGKGAIEGVAGPEAANNAAAQTSFIPLLTLGIPAHPVMALIVGAFIIQGITPGPTLMTDEPTLFWALIASMWIGNLLLVVLNLPLIGLWVRLLKVPQRVLFPAIIVFAGIGTYSLELNPFHVLAVAVFGVLGYILVKCGSEPAPLLLGFVLGPLLESNMRRALLISHGDPSVFFTRPISAVMLVLALIALLVAMLPMIRKRRDKVFVEDD